MSIRAPLALRVIHSPIVSTCPRSGRVQPSLYLFLARPFVPLNVAPLHRTRLQRASYSTEGPYLNLEPKPRKGNVQVAKFTTDINPPASTLPALLSVPDRKPDQGSARYWFSVGKAYWQFYKAGVKNIMANRRAAKAIRQEMSTKGSDSGAEPRTRSDFQLLRRSKAEMRRVPLFVLLLAVFGEWTPLLVIFLTPIVPYNCRIPRQIRKSRQKQELRRKNSFRGVGGGYVPAVDDVRGEGIDTLDISPDALHHICRNLNLYPSWLDWPALTWIPGWSPFAKHRVKISTEYLREDDSRLLFEQPSTITARDIPRQLTDHEARIAAEERGIDVLERPIADVRKDLGLWLQLTQSMVKSADSQQSLIRSSMIERLMMRPNQWQHIGKAISPPKSSS